jgi:hypothetical protein
LKTSHFFSERDAMEFVVSEIADEANRAGKPLTPTEREMLSFRESGPNARELSDLVEAFDRDCNPDEYERRIVQLIRAARKRAGEASRASWSAATKRLDRSDFYVAVMLHETGTGHSLDLSWRGGVVVLTLLGALVGFQFVVGWYVGHTATRDEEGFFAWLVVMVAAAIYIASRWLFGAQSVDRLVGRVVDSVFKTPKR